MPVVSIFGSSSVLNGSKEYKDAFRLGEMLAVAGFDLATGAYYGIMEAALKGACIGNNRRIGVTTDFYKGISKNEFVNYEIRTSSYDERLHKLISIGDAYVILPGGTGTLLELAKIWAMKKRGLFLDRICICVGEQWEETIQTMAFYSDEIFDSLGLIKITRSIEYAVEKLKIHFNKNNI